jgi:hypothetical protein
MDGIAFDQPRAETTNEDTMNKILMLSVAAAVGLAMPMSAYAANVTAGAAAGASTAAGANAAGNAATASTSLTAGSSYSDLISSMSGTTGTTVDFSTVTPTSTVKIIKISSLKGYKSGGASLKTAMKSNTGLKGLDANVAGNAGLTAKLKAQGLKPTDVVAVSSDASGGLILFVNK